MRAEIAKESGGELRLVFADGSSVPFAIRELVATIRHRKVLALTCLFAVLLALPGGGAYSEAVPLWARLALNLFSVGLFAILFPALLQEAETWAHRRRVRRVYEPAITLPTAIITTLAVEALAVFVVGSSDLTRWDLALKLGFGAVFWELHITMMLMFMGPSLREEDRPEAISAVQAGSRPGSIRIGTALFDPSDLLRIETDDHFLILHRREGQARVLARLAEVQGRLAAHGVQVHRCHWVSFAELGEVTRQGRSFQMQTRSGPLVPVARDRRKAVLNAMADAASRHGIAG